MFWSYHYMMNMHIVQFSPLFNLPLSNLRLDQYSLNHCERWWCIGRKVQVFDSDYMNIGPIVNVRAWGERGAKTTQSTYRSCHDTIRTQILNWSQNCRLRKPGFWWEPVAMVRFLVPTRNRAGNLYFFLTLPTRPDHLLTQMRPCHWHLSK